MMSNIEKRVIAVINKYVKYVPDNRHEQLQLMKYADGSIIARYKILTEVNGKILTEVQLTDEQVALFDWQNNVWGYQNYNGAWYEASKGLPYQDVPDMRGKAWLTPDQLEQLGINQNILPE